MTEHAEKSALVLREGVVIRRLLMRKDFRGHGEETSSIL
jgi:hypothetical protein